MSIALKYILPVAIAAVTIGCSGSDFIEDKIQTAVGDHSAKLEVKAISVPSYVNEQEDVNVSVIIEDVYDSVLWEATYGSFLDSTQTTTVYTHPKANSDLEVTITVTACNSVEKICRDSSKKITVYPNSASNRPPTIDSISIDGQVVTESSTVSLTAIVKDDDGDNLTYQWSATLGTFGDQTSLSTTYIAPSVNYDTKGVITLGVSDGKSTQSLSVYVTIKDATSPADNHAPEIQSVNIPSTMSDSSSAIFNVLATDSDGDTLSYFWKSNEGTFDNNQIQTPLYTSVAGDSNTSVQVTVCDSKNSCTASNIYSIGIIASSSSSSSSSNSAPTIQGVSIPSSIERNSSVTLNVLAFDAQSDALSYFWTVDQGYYNDNQVQKPLYTATTTESKVTIQVTVCDTHGACTTSSKYSVTIK